MKKSVLVGSAMIIVVFFFVNLNNSLLGQERDYEKIATNVIESSLNIKAGEMIVIYGGKHTIPFMEALAIAAQKKGGMVEMILNTDKVIKSKYTDLPDKVLDIEPTYFGEWIKNADVWISLSTVENPKTVFGDIPQKRLARASKSFEYINDMLDESGLRGVNISYPTEQRASINDLDFTVFEDMYWKALDEDYKSISNNGNKIKEILSNAKRIRISSPSGTDFVFAAGDRPIFVDDGIVSEEEAKAKRFLGRWLFMPGGSVYFAPIETSANGKVIIPKERCKYKPLTGISFEFKKGIMTNFKAEKGQDCFEKSMAPYSGPKDRFGYFSIGLNPSLKVIEDDGDYRPMDAAGMVWIAIGDNKLYGGENKEPGGNYFPITNATVEVDGKVIVKNGKLNL